MFRNRGRHPACIVCIARCGCDRMLGWLVCINRAISYCRWIVNESRTGLITLSCSAMCNVTNTRTVNRTACIAKNNGKAHNGIEPRKTNIVWMVHRPLPFSSTGSAPAYDPFHCRVYRLPPHRLLPSVSPTNPRKPPQAARCGVLQRNEGGGFTAPQ